MAVSDLAMVSRVRVEVRGGSMESAERAAFLFLDHARLAGLLEGIVPQGGGYTDHFFSRPTVTLKPGAEPDPWNETGMLYAGRMTFSFDPEVVEGGLRQRGYKVVADESDWEVKSGGHGEDVTATTMVLPRQRPVTREHSWESSGPMVPMTGEFPATAEDVLDNIRRLVNVKDVGVTSTAALLASGGVVWNVVITLDTEYPHSAGSKVSEEGVFVESDSSLLQAALRAYGMCGAPVTHYITR